MTDPTWDAEVDLLVAGTGAAGLSAAIAARLNGLDTLLVESTDKWGGTTCISGGGLWLPANPVMLRDGAIDSIPEALAYMEETIGEPGPWASRARKLAFLHGVDGFVRMTQEQGLHWRRSVRYPDYYPDLPGGRLGRCIELRWFDMHRLRGFQKRSRMREGLPAAIRNDDVWQLGRAFSTVGGFVRGARVVARIALLGIAGTQARGMGPALAGGLMWVARKNGARVWLSSPVTEVVRDDDGRVVGAVVLREGTPVRVRARRGVMLASGGFARNAEWRQELQGVPGWTAAPEGQDGSGIRVGMAAGGAVAMMEDAWWGAGVPTGEHATGFVLGERSFPYSLIVDQTGQRYMNESESYIDIGHDMLARDRVAPAIPSWLVTDRRHGRRYLNTFLIGAGGRWARENGSVVQAPTLEELADALGIDRVVLRATIERFNGFARAGVDRDFQRGRTAYDRYYGDPTVRPNPNLAPLEVGPFTAYRIVPSDLGTKGGLVTDEHARVLDAAGAVIPGLYAAGNASASVMGHTYPGPGATIGPAAVFGYLGALHAAQQARNPDAPMSPPFTPAEVPVP
jgi:3-oxosteroid 1-dehydrogenase